MISTHVQRYDYIIENWKENFFLDQEGVLDLVKGFFIMCFFFSFHFVYIVYYIDIFSYVDLSQHFWDKVDLIMLDDPFDVLLR